MSKEEQNKQLENIVDIQGQSISLSDIKSISRNDEVRKQFEKNNTGELYSSILLSLTHETYNEEEAKILWHEITAHMQNLENILGRPVGISVAAMDYLSNIKNILNEPIIIQEEKSDIITEATTIDELTQLYTRDVFVVTLQKNIDESIRTQSPLSLLMIDIDDFKKINDQYGHQKGDEVLRKIGYCINLIVREMDMAARYGGEELVVILPNTDIEEAYTIAERIRESINKLDFAGFSVTVSIGVAESHGSKETNTPDALVKQADERLYNAKEAGKNQTVQE